MPDGAARGGLTWTWHRARTHWRWGREHGWRRLVEEDQLDPVDRLRLATSKALWRRAQGVEGTARPVFLVGLQRSGTNMVVRGLERAPEVEVHNENDRRLFERFRIRDERVGPTCARSRHRVVLFKPLCDSHRVEELLSLTGSPTARAVWIYRGVDDRGRSSLAKFGAHNLDVVRRIADGTAGSAWQAGGLGADAVALVRRLDPGRMDARTAAALFWYLRNSLVFSLGLDRRPDVLLTSYESFVDEPGATMERIADWVGLPPRPELVGHVARRHDAPGPLVVDPRVRELCDDLWDRLERVRQRSAA